MLQTELHNRMIKGMKKDEEGNSSFGIINYLHNKIHEGKMLFSSHVFETVLNDGIVYLRLKVGALKYLHVTLNVETTGLWKFESFQDTTYTDDGTELTQWNRKSDSEYEPDSMFWHTPTIDVLGTPRLNFVFGSGTNPAKATSGSFSERLESEFEPDLDILVRLTNLSGSTQMVSGVYDYYEEE